jgi:hypothetical protein
MASEGRRAVRGRLDVIKLWLRRGYTGNKFKKGGSNEGTKKDPKRAASLKRIAVHDSAAERK